jgi:PAS domain S-box-containing protein
MPVLMVIINAPLYKTLSRGGRETNGVELRQQILNILPMVNLWYRAFFRSFQGGRIMVSSSKGTSVKVKGTEEDDVSEGMINRLPMGIIIMDKEGRIQFVNGYLKKLVGMDQQSIVGTYLFDLLEPSGIPEIVTLLKDGGWSGKRLDLSMKTPSGRLISGAFLFEMHESMGAKDILITIMERKPQPPRREIGFETLEELPFPVTIVDRDLRLVFQNSACDEQISLAAKGKDPIKFPKRARSNKLRECLSTGKPLSYTVDFITSEGKAEFDVFVVPVPSRSKPVQAMEVWTSKDTGTRSRRSDEVPAGLGNELIETSNAIIIGLDLEGNILLFNTGASRALGYMFDEVEGRSWFDFLLDHDAEKGKLEVFKWTIGSGFRTQYESRVRARSGETLVISLENTIIFEDDGKISMVLMVGQDITQMKRLEETLRDQSEKLVEAMEEVGLYNDLMIHDIHNVNAGIMGYIELLTLPGISEEKKKEYINRALQEVRKSSSIIKDVKIMSMARPVIEPSPLSLNDVIKRSIERCGEKWGEKCAVVEHDIPDLTVLADELLTEAVMRILDNSISHGKTDRLKVRIEARRDPSRSNLVPGPIHLTIQDNGGGIDDAVLKELFKRPKRTGLEPYGLGLYLVKKIIDRFGGLVWLENTNKPENGLTVHLLLSEAV